jgi:hypothetical protein
LAVSIRRRHLGHLEQPLHVLAEQVTNHQQAEDEAESGHHRAQRQVRRDQLHEHCPLGHLCARPDQQRRNDKGAGHQQTEDDHRDGEADTCVHSLDLFNDCA